MRLREFRVRGFRCIHDSGLIAVGDIAALVGKNESGKTALLEALTYLNKETEIAELDLCDEMHEELEKDGTIIRATFEFSDAEKKTIAKAFATVPPVTTISIEKKFGTKSVVYGFGELKFPTTHELIPEKHKAFNETLVFLQAQLLLAQTTITVGEKPIPDELWNEIQASLTQLMGTERLEKQRMDAIYLNLEKLLKPKLESVAVAKELGAAKKAYDEIFKSVDVGAQLRKFVYDKFHPKFVYFSEYREIYGTVHVPTFLAGSEASTPLAADTGLSLDKKAVISNLFLLAGLDPAQLEKVKKDPQLRERYLRKCSQRLTEALAKTWKTQTVEIDLDYGIGDVLTVQVCDVHDDGSRSNHGHLSRRSQGFRWHFSFYVNFIAETHQEQLSEAILLLDEPGVHLHPAQQVGMLDVLRELAQSNQILYTTHSPFMLYDYNVGAILTVELDHMTHLSKVSPIIWKGDPETIYPILQVLGSPLLPGLSEPSLAPFSPPVLIVEGHTDLMYLLVFEQISAERKKSTFRPRIWQQPAGGSSRIGPLAMFYFERKFRTFALFDKEPEAREHAKSLEEQGFPKECILYCDADGREESDVEDLFTQEDYLRAVNDLYRKILKDAKFALVTPDDIDTAKKAEPPLSRIVPVLERIWNGHKDDGWGSFDKTKVCAKALELANADVKYPTEKSLNRFDALLTAIYTKVGFEKDVRGEKRIAKK